MYKKLQTVHFESQQLNINTKRARVNQQPPMHQLAVLSTGCLAFFHSAPDGVHDSPFLFAADHCTFFFWFVVVFPWT